MKTVFAYIDSINEMDFQKDVILTPSYLAKHLECSCDLYYGQTTSSTVLPDKFRNVTLHNINKKPRTISYYMCLLGELVRNHKHIEFLLTFHLSTHIIIYTFILKLLNSKSQVWVLGDMNKDVAEELCNHEFVYSRGLKGAIKKIIISLFFHTVDVFSLETRQNYNMFLPVFNKNGWKSLRYYPCSWDEDNIYSKKINIDAKENIILSCARFGTYQKNTEMLLEALSKLIFHDWKVYLVGPITNGFDLGKNIEFEKYINNFFKNNPNLKSRVIFTGPVFDTKELFAYFQKAKVFVMTSRFEGFGNVFAQARWNRCHIVSTDVGGACDMSNQWEWGHEVPQEDSTELYKILQDIINNGCVLPSEEFSISISYNYTIQNYILNE